MLVALQVAHQAIVDIFLVEHPKAVLDGALDQPILEVDLVVAPGVAAVVVEELLDKVVGLLAFREKEMAADIAAESVLDDGRAEPPRGGPRPRALRGNAPGSAEG
jgi:hypothetical protein